MSYKILDTYDLWSGINQGEEGVVGRGLKLILLIVICTVENHVVKLILLISILLNADST